jgi:hypothetical protein
LGILEEALDERRTGAGVFDEQCEEDDRVAGKSWAALGQDQKDATLAAMIALQGRSQ